MLAIHEVDFVNGGRNCLKCIGYERWNTERFMTIAAQIHGGKYDYSMVTTEHIQTGRSEFPIRCNNCGNVWWTTVQIHITVGCGCRRCSFSKGYSKGQIEWIDTLMKTHNTIIQYALSPGGEHCIPGIGKVDGYHAESNTIFEYHGDFWHGNPKKFPPNEVNPISSISYGEIIQKDNGKRS